MGRIRNPEIFEIGELPGLEDGYVTTVSLSTAREAQEIAHVVCIK